MPNVCRSECAAAPQVCAELLCQLQGLPAQGIYSDAAQQVRLLLQGRPGGPNLCHVIAPLQPLVGWQCDFASIWMCLRPYGSAQHMLG